MTDTAQAPTAAPAAPGLTLTLDWGLRPSAAAAVAWGSRAIARGGVLAVRTKTGKVKVKNGRVQEEYRTWIEHVPGRQAVAGDQRLFEALDRLIKAAGPFFDSHADDRVVVFNNLGPGISASIRGWVGDYAHCGVEIQKDDLAWEQGIWSGKGSVPEVGTVVTTPFGEATVIRRVLVHGYTGVVVIPHTPPGWWVTQNPGKVAATFFGAELR